MKTDTAVKRGTAIKRLKRYCLDNELYSEVKGEDLMIFYKDSKPTLHNLEQYLKDNGILKEGEVVVGHYRNRKVMSDKDMTQYQKQMKNYGNSADYRIAKLKRDFGKDAVMEAVKTCKTVSDLERKLYGEDYRPKMLPATKVYRAFERLDETERAYAHKMITDLFELGISHNK